MNLNNICVHNDDGEYKIQPDMRLSDMQAQFSAVDISDHKLKEHSEALNGKIWDDSETIYWQLDSTYGFMTEKEQISAIKNAFLETSLFTPLKIQQKRRQSGDAHIRINWLDSKDERYFDKHKSVLAFAYGPQKGIGGDITMNADRIWRLDRSPLTAEKAAELGFIKNFDNPHNIIKSFDPAHTLKHEGGHAIGMGHLENVNGSKTEILYPYYNGVRMFGFNDLEYITRLYGRISQWRRAIRIAQRYMGKL